MINDVPTIRRYDRTLKFKQCFLVLFFTIGLVMFCKWLYLFYDTFPAPTVATFKVKLYSLDRRTGNKPDHRTINLTRIGMQNVIL